MNVISKMFGEAYAERVRYISDAAEETHREIKEINKRVSKAKSQAEKSSLHSIADAMRSYWYERVKL